MFAGSLILGLTLIIFAFWLHNQETAGWEGDTDETELDQQYLSGRSRARKKIHYLIGACGVAILVAAFAGPQEIWVWLIAWTMVIIGLFVVVILAGLDAIRTQRYHAEKLPEIRREIWGDKRQDK